MLNSGKASDAVNALQNAVKDSPKDAFLQYWLGRAALAKGDIDLAESSLRQAATLNPSRLEAEEELARIASQRGDMDLLADVADKTIAAAPRFPDGYVWRAMVEISHNAADKAEADLKTAMSIAPKARRPISSWASFASRRSVFQKESRCWNRHCNMTLIPSNPCDYW